jgi:hypothetical protein
VLPLTVAPPFILKDEVRHRAELCAVLQDAALHEAEEVDRALAKERLRYGGREGWCGSFWWCSSLFMRMGCGGN